MPLCKNDPKRKYKGDEPSPKGLGWCAHGEKEGNVRKGLDGNKWIVKKVKNGSKRWVRNNVIKNNEEKNSTVFVFYTFQKTERWKYGKLPNNWWWVGQGTTSSIGTKKKLYEFEEQFDGPSKNKVKMRDYLDKFFTKLKNKGILKRYKIRNTFLP